MRKIKLASAAIITILLIIIIFQNLDPVSTRLLFWTVKPPQAALIFIAAVAGFALGVVGSFTFFKRN
ncbi:LapA family protein [Candidatus Bipolaricaulota bacterium]|nr:LapA family protein [Candidatus Bipolaricaulota bacterium]